MTECFYVAIELAMVERFYVATLVRYVAIECFQG